MNAMKWARSIGVGILAVGLAACAPKPPPLPTYPASIGSPPRSILVIPVVNTSTEVEAADAFLATLAVPLAERGYYVFPTTMVKRVMEDDGLGDADMVHAADTKRLAAIFGADAVLYAKITDWNSRYIVLAASTSVAIQYDLRLGRKTRTLPIQLAHRTKAAALSARSLPGPLPRPSNVRRLRTCRWRLWQTPRLCCRIKASCRRVRTTKRRNSSDALRRHAARLLPPGNLIGGGWRGGRRTAGACLPARFHSA